MTNQKLSLEDLKKDLPNWQEEFPQGTKVSFVLARGVWADLFTMTGEVVEVRDDPLQTFVVKLDKPDLLVMPQAWEHEDHGHAATVHGSLLLKVEECPEEETRWLNKGQSIIEQIGESIEGLSAALGDVVQGLEDEYGYAALQTLNRIEAGWAEEDVRTAIRESKFLFVDDSVTMQQGVDKLKSIVEMLKVKDEGKTPEDHE